MVDLMARRDAGSLAVALGDLLLDDDRLSGSFYE